MQARRTIVKKRPKIDPKTGKIIPTEYQECLAFFQYAKAQGFSEDLIKIANERKESDSWFIVALYAIGFKKGILDYQYIVPNEKYNSLWLEMKRTTERNKKKKPEQDEWIVRLRKRGHYATYAYGCDDAIQIYQNYKNNLI